MRVKVNQALIHYRKVNTIFGASLIEGTTKKEGAIYVNEARKSNYQMILMGPPSVPSRPILFSDMIPVL